ncbi:uncharacterized protein [Amphiura filiformis]|uniref:uncharacterized protein n=1 Tax=Amphiura filiformis TaxID=82378 RepID=UPI003B220132
MRTKLSNVIGRKCHRHEFYPSFVIIFHIVSECVLYILYRLIQLRNYGKFYINVFTNSVSAETPIPTQPTTALPTTVAPTTTIPTTTQPTTTVPTTLPTTAQPTTTITTTQPTTTMTTTQPTTTVTTTQPTTTMTTTQPTTIMTTTQPTTTMTTTQPTTTITTTEPTTTKITTTLPTTTVDPNVTIADINECDSNPCASGATCIDRPYHYICNCPFGFDGVHCENELYPTFDYSTLRNIELEELDSDLIHHPYYQVAQMYNPVSPLSPLNILKHSTVETVIGRLDKGEYYQLTGTRSWIDPTAAYTGSSPLQIKEAVNERSNGFTLSFWMYLDKTARAVTPSTLYNSGRAYDSNKVSVSISLTASKVLTFKVNDGTNIAQLKVINAEIPYNEWAHFVLTWRADLGSNGYINGEIITRRSSSTASGQSSNNNPWKVTLGTNDRYGSLAMAPLTISDFVAWPRYLYPFEFHHIIGMTDSEYSNLREAYRYWTSDAFLRRDQQVLLKYHPSIASTKNMSIPDDQPLQVVPGMDGKGNALFIDGSSGHWLHLGVEENYCLSNPQLCTNGATVTIICKLVRPADEEYHFVFSSGAQSTRGFALYQRERKLGAIVADGDNKWQSEVAAPLDWAHISISWHKDKGLNFYINGNLEGADWAGVRKIRSTDSDTRIIIGRRNDFMGGYSDVYFEELALRERFVEPWEAREVFKIYGNSIYDACAYYWNYKLLVSSSFKMMTDKETFDDGNYIGPRGEIATENPPVVRLTHPNAYINLGNFGGECITETDLCVDGLSVSFWLKISHQVFSQREYLFSSGAESSPYYATGLSVYLESLSIYVKVITTYAQWTMSTSLDYIPNNEWANIGVSWDSSDNSSSSIQAWINGVKPTHTIRNFEAFSSNGPWQDAATDVIIGRHNYEESGYGGFSIHSLAIWESPTTDRRASRLLGLSDPELQCYADATFCWMFEYPTMLRQLHYPSPTGTHITTSRNLRGKAICTDGIDGYVVLGNYTGQCPSNPELCPNGFALAMWMMLYSLPQDVEFGYVASLGAEKEDEIGLVVTQTSQGLEVTVADDDTMWQGSATDKIKYGSWIYFAIVWSSRTGLQLSIDGESVGILLKRIATLRPKEDYTGLRLGGSGGDTGGFVKACFDDVALYIPDENEELPTMDSLTGTEASSYNAADEYYDVTDPNGPVEGVNTESTIDRTHQENGAADTSTESGLGYLNLGSFAGKCVSDPARCNPAGVTISMWLRMGNIDHFTDQSTNPAGLGYILSSGAQHELGRGFVATYNGSAIEAYVIDGTKEWRVLFPIDLEQSWRNFAMTWSSTSGLAVFIDGAVQASDREGVLRSSTRVDFFTTLHLGKRNDRNADYLGAAFDDTAIWYHAFDEDDPETASVVKGDVPDPDVITDGNTEDSDPDTGKPSCQIIHEADCARTMTELFTLITDEPDFNSVAIRSATLRMQALAEPDNYLSSDELNSATLNLKKLTDVPKPDRLNETVSQAFLDDYLKIASRLLDTNRSDSWYTVHQQRKAGTTSIMRNLDYYGMNISQRIHSRDAKLLAESENIVLTIDKVSSSSFHQKFILPKKTERRWRIANESWLTIEDSIQLPENFLDHVEGDRDEGILVFTVFTTLQDMAPTTTTGFNKVKDQTPWFNSHVLSCDVYPRLEQTLVEPIIIEFKHVVTLNSSFIKKPSCGYWNFDVPKTTNGAWDNEGCETVKTNNTHTICQCYHLTHFVIVMEPIVAPARNWDLVKSAWIIRVFGLLSAWFLLMLLYNFITTDRLRTLRHTIHLHQCIAALFATLAFVVSDFARLNKLSCLICGACMHLFYLAYIYWVSIEMIQLIRDIWYGLHKNDAAIGFALYRHKMGWYTLLAWGVPVASVAATLGLALSDDPYYEHEYGLCWLTNSDGLLWSFAGPCSIAMCINLILMSFIVKGLTEKVRLQDKTTGFRSGVRGTAFLTLMFAITWLLGCYGIYGGPVDVYYAFVFFNACLGIFMFICHGMANIEVRAVICQNDPDFELSAVQAVYIPPSPEPTSDTSIDRPAYLA